MWLANARALVDDYDVTDAEKVVFDAIGTIVVVVRRCSPGPDEYTVPSKSEPRVELSKAQFDGAGDSSPGSSSCSQVSDSDTSDAHVHFRSLDGNHDDRPRRRTQRDSPFPPTPQHPPSPVSAPTMPWCPCHHRPAAPSYLLPLQNNPYPPIVGAGDGTTNVLGTGCAFEVGAHGTRPRSGASNAARSNTSSKSGKKSKVSEPWGKQEPVSKWQRF